MTPQEKAKELFDKYFDMKWQSYNKKITSIKSMTKSSAKKCALILAVETKLQFMEVANYDKAAYWRLVELEIDKL